MTEFPFIASVHLVVGSVTVIAGFGAMGLRKGHRLHRLCGNVFFWSMLMLCASGVYLSIVRSITATLFLALITVYLVATGYIAAKKQSCDIGLSEKALFLFILLITLTVFGLGIAQSIFKISMGGDVPSGMFYFLAVFSALFSALDYRLIKRGTITRKHKIARHLWRMCASLLIATIIFFFGNNDVLPEILQHPYFLATPVMTVFLVMVFWSIKILTSSKANSIINR